MREREKAAAGLPQLSVWIVEGKVKCQETSQTEAVVGRRYGAVENRENGQHRGGEW